MAYEKYFMHDAAVSMEAYDVSAGAAEMVDSAWGGVPVAYQASDWSSLFTNTDFRASLSWRGRFAGIANAVNCYSETEDVLQNPEMHGYGGAWSMQELLKGTAAWSVLNAVPYYGRGVEDAIVVRFDGDDNGLWRRKFNGMVA